MSEAELEIDELVFRRTTWRAWLFLLLSVAALAATMVAAALTSELTTADGRTIRLQFLGGWKLGVFLVLWGSLLVWSVQHLRLARRFVIVVSATGLGNSSPGGVAPLPWGKVADLDLIGTEQTGYRLKVTLAEGAEEMVEEIDLEGIEPGPEGVFQAALERWQQHKPPTSH